MIDKLLNGTFVVSVNRKNRVIIARLDIDLFIRYQIGSHCTGTDRLSLIVNVTLPEPCQPKEI